MSCIEATISKIEDNETIPMGDMKPLEVGVIVGGTLQGEIVMRSQTVSHCNIMHLSDLPGNNGGWTAVTKGKGYDVRPLKKGEKLTITIKGTAC